MTRENHIRILRAATHWAGGMSKAFGDEVLACAGSLTVTQAEGGAITLRGANTARHPVSICLAAGEGGLEIHLLRVEEIIDRGFAAIRTTEIRLTLPQYLACQLGSIAVAA